MADGPGMGEGALDVLSYDWMKFSAGRNRNTDSQNQNANSATR
jgi:hypothetical protein